MFRETICCLCLRAFSLPTRYRSKVWGFNRRPIGFYQNGEMRSQESNYMYSSCTKSTIKNQNTQLTEKSVGITMRIFSDYPIEKSQYPINKKISGYYPIHQNFLSGALILPAKFIHSTVSRQHWSNQPSKKT